MEIIGDTQVDANLIRSLQTGITAAGTNQGTATALTLDINNVTSVASGAGVILPALSTGAQITVLNNDTNSLLVYPQSGGTIDAGATNAPITITVGSSWVGSLISSTAWETVSSTGTTVTPGGSAGQVQYNNAGAFGGAANVNIESDGNLSLTSQGTSIPTTPSTTLKLFDRTVANRHMLATMDITGDHTVLQPILARNKVGYWNPPGNATTVPGVFGITAFTAIGNATARNVATTNLATRMRRIGYPSIATAGNFAGARIGVAQFTAGSGSSDGSGFFMVERWVESDPAAVTGRRAFAGLSSSTANQTNVEPSTLTNVIGIGQISTDATQWYWIQGGSTAQTAVAIGTGIGAPAGNSTTAWELAISAPAGIANTFYLQLTNLSTGVVATTTMTGTTVQVPQSTTLLAWRHWATNNATALAVGVDICSLYFETDN